MTLENGEVVGVNGVAMNSAQRPRDRFHKVPLNWGDSWDPSGAEHFDEMAALVNSGGEFDQFYAVHFVHAYHANDLIEAVDRPQ